MQNNAKQIKTLLSLCVIVSWLDLENFVDVEIGKKFDKSFDIFVQIFWLNHANVARIKRNVGARDV